MKLTAAVIPAPEGGYTAYVEEIPGAISEGETIEEAREDLADALCVIFECHREIVRAGATDSHLSKATPAATL